MNWNRLEEIEGRFFTERHIRLYGTGFAVAYGLAFAWRLFHGQWIFLPDGRLRCVDFGWMWLSGKLAASGNPEKIFDHSIFSSAQLALFSHDNCPFLTPYVYPPTYLFFTYLFGFMPYVLAFAAWVLVTLVLYGVAVYAIIPRPAAVIAAMAPFPVAVNADFAHNGFITAALIGLSLVSLERRPMLAGGLLGVLTYKPHIGMLFPLALLASRNWRALAGAVATSIALALAAALAFGCDGWSYFFQTLIDRHATLSPDGAVELALHSVFGLLRWVGMSASFAWFGHLIVAAAVATAVCVIWFKPIAFSLKAAVLCIGSAMMSPYILFYDLCILCIGVGFLIRDGVSRGFLPAERIVVFACLLSLFVVRVPVGPIVCATLLSLIARRIFVYRRLQGRLIHATDNNFEMTAFSGD